jgi:hypothetical protein
MMLWSTSTWTLVGVEVILIGSHVRIDPKVILLATGPLTIGCYTHIAAGVFIAAKAGFEMKNFANIATVRASIP